MIGWFSIVMNVLLFFFSILEGQAEQLEWRTITKPGTNAERVAFRQVVLGN